MSSQMTKEQVEAVRREFEDEFGGAAAYRDKHGYSGQYSMCWAGFMAGRQRAHESLSAGAVGREDGAVERALRTLAWYGMRNNYMPARTGGVVEGCPRNGRVPIEVDRGTSARHALHAVDPIQWPLYGDESPFSLRPDPVVPEVTDQMVAAFKSALSIVPHSVLERIKADSAIRDGLRAALNACRAAVKGGKS